MYTGKAVRLERLFNRTTRRCIIVPLDHGVSHGPIAGLSDVRRIVSEVAEGGADAVLMHKGLVRNGHRAGGRDLGLIVHLSASTDLSPTPNAKILVASVEDAIKLGADGISVHVNMGDASEGAMLADLGRTAREAAAWGMPLLAMMYARGEHIKDPFAPAVVAHTARVAAELGADIVKVPYTGNKADFAGIVASCPIPIVIAGGPKVNSPREFLQTAYEAMQAGAVGLSVGRNIFQHTYPQGLVAALAGIVHANWSVDRALSITGEA